MSESEQVMQIFVLCKEQLNRNFMSGNTEKIMEGTQVLDRKFLLNGQSKLANKSNTGANN